MTSVSSKDSFDKLNDLFWSQIMKKLNIIAFTCFVAGSASVLSAQTISNTIVNRIDHTKQFIDDRFALSGTIRARADGGDTSAQYGGSAAQTEGHLNADLWLSARLYRDWTAKMEVEPQFNFRTGKMSGDVDLPMNKFYLEGSLSDQLKLRLGKFGSFSSYGRVFDNAITGGELTFVHPVMPTKLTLGRLTNTFNGNPWGVGVHRHSVAILQSKYPLTTQMNIGGTLGYVSDVTRQNGISKDAWFGEVGVDTRFSPDLMGYVAYSRSDIDDTYDVVGNKVAQGGVFAEVKYKNADWEMPHSYDVYMNARHVGAMSGVSSSGDYSKNVKGIQLGANYVPYRNVKLGGFYLFGKQVNPTALSGKKNNVNVWRVQAEYKF